MSRLKLRVILAAGAALVVLPAFAQVKAAVPPAKPAAEQGKVPAAPVAASTLPGGASSLSEQYGSWTVACSMNQAGKQCAFSEALTNNQTGRLGISMQLRPAAGGKVEGIILTQLGQRLDAGVTLTLDDKPLLGPLPFLACIDSGCLVPVALGTEALTALKAGTALKLAAVSVNGNQPVSFTLALAGFGAALTRTSDLLK
jgi:invasion protein IalB